MTKARLLLVEDDPALAELLEFRFTAEGYAVSVTPDGDEALLLAQEEAPDLVVLDADPTLERHPLLAQALDELDSERRENLSKA